MPTLNAFKKRLSINTLDFDRVEILSFGSIACSCTREQPRVNNLAVQQLKHNWFDSFMKSEKLVNTATFSKHTKF